MRLTALGTAGATLAALLVTVAHPATAAPPPLPAPTVHAVTLVTGDRVQVLHRADGTRDVAVSPGPGRDGIPMLRRVTRDELRIVPADAQPLLAAGTLDPRLFDVARLIRDGYDSLPLIVGYRPGVAPPRALAGATVRRALPSVHGVAVTVASGEFWSSLAQAPVERVWLDGRSRLLDDVSNAQIGVPTAWQAGYTGRGVAVAVLDSGYDAAHPDLANVVEAKDFTGSPDGTKDVVGHGTHVASILAGSGAASDGRHRGVAPDARLLVGKVCGDEYCEDSDIIAGMEWAAAQRAKVVNLSLGNDGSDGTDPLAVAVDTLTASSGALFVAAAGNGGVRGKVGSPAAADAALAVGSVNSGDAISTFSSRGPRLGDLAIKPDVTAPGERIQAARAGSAGGPYVAKSGTSMASPHVAGAAALLAQQHPEWTAAELKGALMSTAKPGAGQSVNDQGAGRVDVARAVTQPVHAAPGSLSFGLLRWPRAGRPPATRTVSYRNSGASPVTLTLSLSATGPDGTQAPAGAFGLDATTLTVPANGTAEARVTQRPDALETAPTGSYTGELVATDGTAVTRTPVSVTTEPEAYDVQVTMLDRNGRTPDDALGQYLTFFQLDYRGGGAEPPDVEPVGGKATVRLTKGTYAVHSATLTADPAAPGVAGADVAVATVPSLTVDRPGITVAFDARRARKVDALVDARDVTHVNGTVAMQYTAVGDGGDVPTTMSVSGGPGNDLYATPLRHARGFTFGYETILAAGDDRYFLAIPVSGRVPADPRFRLRGRDLYRTDARYHSLGVPAAIADRVEFGRYMPHQNSSFGTILATPLPSRRTEYFSATGSWSGSILQQYLPAGPKLFFEGQVDGGRTVYPAGRSRTQHWNNGVSGPDLGTADTSNVVAREGDTLGVQVSSFSPGEPRHSGSPVGDLFMVKGTTTLHRDGVLLGRRTFAGLGTFQNLPAEPGRYTLAIDATRAKPWATTATQALTSWTFTSATTTEATRLPLPTVKVTGDFDGQGFACAGARFTLSLTPSVRLASVTLDMSTDDGATWTPVRVHGGTRATVPNPAAGYVSLRLRATDAAGATVEQTVLRAYGVR